MNTVATSLAERSALRPAIVFAVTTLLGFGLLYSLAGTALGRVLFPGAARGSLVERNGHVVGSSLVAQPFADARYFQPRPSASNFDPMAMSASNLARSNPDLRKRIATATTQVAARDGIDPARVPAELVTQSGSGLDPHLSSAGAQAQVMRVAKARGMPVDQVQATVAATTEAPQFGFLGQPRVNVLQLDLAMDARVPDSLAP